MSPFPFHSLVVAGIAFRGQVSALSLDLEPVHAWSIPLEDPLFLVVFGVAIRRHDNVVAAGGRGRGVYLCQLDGTMRTIRGGHEKAMQSVAFSPDGERLASAGDAFDPTIRTWSCAHGDPLAVYAGHTGRIWCVTFSPDGRRLATGSGDGTVKLWDALAE